MFLEWCSEQEQEVRVVFRTGTGGIVVVLGEAAGGASGGAIGGGKTREATPSASNARINWINSVTFAGLFAVMADTCCQLTRPSIRKATIFSSLRGIGATRNNLCLSEAHLIHDSSTFCHISSINLSHSLTCKRGEKFVVNASDQSA